MQMKKEHYPGLFQGADMASASAQRSYFLLQRIHLGSLVIGGAIGILTSVATGHTLVWTYAAMAIVLALGLLILWVARSREDDKAWFDCRAVAESVKTATWRFMMSTPPFADPESLDERFVSVLKEIRRATPHCQKYLVSVAASASTATPISDFMRGVRSLPFDDRKRFLVEQRLCIQKSWYAHRAQQNARNGARWFWATVILQGIAVSIAIIQVATGGPGFGIVSVLTTCTAVVAAWNQMKRHDELTKTYAVAAQELGELEAIASAKIAESDFPQLVEQVEEMISREHTMWCARRDVVLRPGVGDVGI